jgi:hypothetical protein
MNALQPFEDEGIFLTALGLVKEIRLKINENIEAWLDSPQINISAPTTLAEDDRIIIVTSGTFTQDIPAELTVEFYTQGTCTITFTYNGTTIKTMGKAPNYVKFVWLSISNSYITK